MQKIPIDEIIKTSLMFWIDNDIEEKYENIYDVELPKYGQVATIGSREGLKDFIKGNVEAIKLLVTALGVSSEKFKRIITALRIKRGHIISGEWSESKTRVELCKDDLFMEEFCDLFFRQEKYTSLFPQSILNDLTLGKDTLNRICSEGSLRKLIKNSYATAYNAECSSAYQHSVLSYVEKVAANYGLSLTKGYERQGFPTTLEIHSISYENRSILLTINYTVTTSTNQSKYARQIQQTKSSIAGEPNLLLINILDGAGWIARTADFKTIYQDCNLFLNNTNISKIDSIIQEFFNIK